MAAPKVKLISSGARKILASAEVKADLLRRIEAIEQACTAESSWGGYYSAVTTDGERSSAKVWSISSNLSESHDRHQRMIRNLDVGA
jgi:hypothetical protein